MRAFRTGESRSFLGWIFWLSTCSDSREACLLVGGWWALELKDPLLTMRAASTQQGLYLWSLEKHNGEASKFYSSHREGNKAHENVCLSNELSISPIKSQNNLY